MDAKTTPAKKKSRFKWTYIETILCFTAVIILFIPFLLSRNWGLPAFTTTGQIGDTIGGTTAPFIGLLGAWLVYKALKAQIEANELITNQFTEQKIMTIVMEQLKILREDINDLEIYANATAEVGSKAIEAVLNRIPTRHFDIERMNTSPYYYIDHLRNVEFFMESICYLISLVNGSSLQPNDKYNLLSIIRETYHSKLRDHLIKHEKDRESKQKVCDKCGKIHGIKENIFILFDKIEAGMVSENRT